VILSPGLNMYRAWVNASLPSG